MEGGSSNLLGLLGRIQEDLGGLARGLFLRLGRIWDLEVVVGLIHNLHSDKILGVVRSVTSLLLQLGSIWDMVGSIRNLHLVQGQVKAIQAILHKINTVLKEWQWEEEEPKQTSKAVTTH